MTSDGGRRVATKGGALLITDRMVQSLPTPPEALFDPQFWRRSGTALRAERGRGSAWFVSRGDEEWALRHYRRGGWIAARFSFDRYLWLGEARVRAFMEWRLLAMLLARGLPVPEAVGAAYRRGWLTYRCDLLTRRIAGAGPLSDLLAAAPLAPALWHDVGALVARFHRAGVDHADLNAHNILVDAQGALHLIDFDRCRIRGGPGGAWRERNLARLRRSLIKVASGLAGSRFGAPEWAALLRGYRG
jgi:3-deoxy-D-manno-octulosonic acid kinase